MNAKQDQKLTLLLGSVALLGAGGLTWWIYRLYRIDYSDFDSPDLPGSGHCMDPELIRKLKKIRRLTGLPIFSWVNSGARSPAKNRAVGGVANSAHLMPGCKAVDLHVPNHAIRELLVNAAVQAGFTRIGIANTFVHLDVDHTKSQYVAWGYPVGNPPPFNPFQST